MFAARLLFGLLGRVLEAIRLFWLYGCMFADTWLFGLLGRVLAAVRTKLAVFVYFLINFIQSNNRKFFVG